MKKINIFLAAIAFSFLIMACGGIKSAADVYSNDFIEMSVKKLKLDELQTTNYTSTMMKYQELYTTMQEKGGEHAIAKSASSIRQMRNDELLRILDKTQFDKFKKLVGSY